MLGQPCMNTFRLLYNWSWVQARGSNSSLSILTLCQNNVFIDKNDSSIKSIFITKTEYKISQYADDTNLILNGSKEAFLAALTFGSM